MSQSKRPRGRMLVAAVAVAGLAATVGSASASSNTVTHAANISAAKAAIAPYIGKPTAFPVTKPLKKRLSSSQQLAYLQCSTPYCAHISQLYTAAAKILHAKLTIVKAGSSSSALESSMSSIISMKPAALLLAGVNLGDLGNTVRQAVSGGIPISAIALVGDKKAGIAADANGAPSMTKDGKLLADWAITIGGAKASTVFYTNAELSFTATEQAAYKAELHRNCPSCTMRVVDIPVATIGTTAPAAETSDLQAHPGTSVAVFASEEAATGLPAALKVAGVKVKVIGAFPAPANLSDIESGGIYGGIGLDSGTAAFAQIDAAVREATHQPLAAGEQNGRPVIQLLTKATLGHSNVSQGWSGYPNFIARFTKLWAGAKS